ncbi:flagellar hook basal-body protein [Rubripirellula sp.]|nr:flagellar hook basal-body protein [Rubripirellula sp.]
MSPTHGVPNSRWQVASKPVAGMGPQDGFGVVWLNELVSARLKLLPAKHRPIAHLRKIVMPYGLYLSASGAHAQSHRMQVLSNNLANVDTPGFKPSDTVLQSRFAEMIEEGQVISGLGGADDIGGGVTINKAETEFAMGPMKSTGGKTDFAIQDPTSFFVLQRGEEQFLTRAGNFTIDSTGSLKSANGAEVLGSDGQPIQLQPGKDFQVAPDGRISQGGNSYELMLAKPKSLGDVSHLGGNEFKPLAEFDLVPEGERGVIAGMLEQSGVRPTAAMMELIETSRVYEANVRMIQNQDSVMGTLISRALS